MTADEKLAGLMAARRLLAGDPFAGPTDQIGHTTVDGACVHDTAR